MDNIQNIVTEVFAIEDTGQQIKLKDKNKKSLGSFFKTKKDGNSTVAYAQFQDMEIKSGSIIEISFKEVPYKDGVIKNIIGFREAAGRPSVTPKTAPQQPITYKPEGQPKDDKFWDKKAYKQCLWNYWLEVMGKTNMLKGDWKEDVWEVFNQIEQDADKRFNLDEIADKTPF